MIARVWHGRTSPDHADSYLEFLCNEGTRDYRQTPGNLSVKVWRTKGPQACDFFAVTEWTGVEAIRQFAGPDFEKAVYYPQDNGVLLEFEERVNHYECRDVSVSRINDFLRQLKEIHEGGSWQGESFSGKLSDLKESQAFAEPIPGIHSIAEIVWHCTYWRIVLLKRFQGDQAYRDRTMKQMNFLPLEDLKRRGWSSLKAEFDNSRRDIEGFLSSKTDDFLTARYQDEKTNAHLLEGIIHHDVYHLGQIGLVKKMLSVM